MSKYITSCYTLYNACCTNDRYKLRIFLLLELEHVRYCTIKFCDRTNVYKT